MLEENIAWEQVVYPIGVLTIATVLVDRVWRAVAKRTPPKAAQPLESADMLELELLRQVVTIVDALEDPVPTPMPARSAGRSRLSRCARRRMRRYRMRHWRRG